MIILPVICSMMVATNAPMVEVTGVAPESKPAAVEKKAEKKAAKVKRPARITSQRTYYDRKEGVAVFTGKVYVDDEQYQMHADKAYVFTVGTNELHRIVAIGNVALTNEARRAYADKVSYYRADGMVVLYGLDGKIAEVREELKSGDRVVKGEKIKFWIDTEQVEVIKSDITAPSTGMQDGLKKIL